MKETNRNLLSARKKVKRSIVSYLKSDVYLFAPLFSGVNFGQSDRLGFEALGVTKKKRRVSEKVKQYLNSDSYMYGPIVDPPKLESSVKAVGFETLGVKKKRRRVSEKVKEYLNYMYGPMISSTNLDSSLKGKLQTTNLVAMEVDVSTSTTTMREDNIYRNLRTDISEQSLHNGRIHSPRQVLDILEGQ